MGAVRSTDIDPSDIKSVRVVGHTVFVADDQYDQAITIVAKDLPAFRSFVTQLADALVTLTAAEDAAALRDEDAEREFDWRASA